MGHQTLKSYVRTYSRIFIAEEECEDESKVGGGGRIFPRSFPEDGDK